MSASATSMDPTGIPGVAKGGKTNHWSQAPAGILTTGIGSLPHHNVDAALEYALKPSIPFLPQIPIRNPNEYMIFQALDGMPGLQQLEKGLASLNLNAWSSQTHLLEKKLTEAFAAGASPQAFEAFEPNASAYSAWKPFLYELGERKIKFAKIQIAGPLTCQWSLKLNDGNAAETNPEVTSQIFRLVLAKSIAMIRRLRAEGVTPLMVLDEPGLSVLSAENPRHILGLQELKLTIQTLKKEQALIGLHCCSNTDWRAILGLGLDVVSLDTGLSMELLFEAPDALEAFIHKGGRMALGLISTNLPAADTTESGVEMHAEQLHASLLAFRTRLTQKLPKALAARLLKDAIYTPACGLAMHRTTAAESILRSLLEISMKEITVA
ncbi:MAG: hypothetical protein AB7P04_04560 [Bacteriovoracia bacterium]